MNRNHQVFKIHDEPESAGCLRLLMNRNLQMRGRVMSYTVYKTYDEPESPNGGVFKIYGEPESHGIAQQAGVLRVCEGPDRKLFFFFFSGYCVGC